MELVCLGRLLQTGDWLLQWHRYNWVTRSLSPLGDNRALQPQIYHFKYEIYFLFILLILSFENEASKVWKGNDWCWFSAPQAQFCINKFDLLSVVYTAESLQIELKMGHNRGLWGLRLLQIPWYRTQTLLVDNPLCAEIIVKMLVGLAIIYLLIYEHIQKIWNDMLL